MKFLESVTGKLSWASAPFMGAALFLASLYKFLAACNAGNKKWVCLPKNVLYDLRAWWWIMMEMPFIVSPRVKSSQISWTFRTDARSTPPSIGGWFGKNIFQKESFSDADIMSLSWFQFDMDMNLF